MKFTLKDYQDEAVREVLTHLRDAREDWHGKRARKSAFSLTAATGAGKTVIAAAVFEALFRGSNEHEFDADPGAVVIWFSDNPSLNEQTRFRLMESSDGLRATDMVVVESPFSRARFEAGKIYFLNTQKLGKNSLLVRGFEGDGGLFAESPPDAQAFTLWDTIRNTIDDPSLTLYLVLDEAHRGMGNPTTAALNEKSTLVKRLINGEKGVPGIPVVWGISATVERFNTAMQGAVGRSILPPVSVDSRRVQESGLLKDLIELEIPDEPGNFDTVLARRAADQLRKSSEAWAQYAGQQVNGETVVPLMVLQVEDKPTPANIAHRLDAIFGQWPDLPKTCVAHVFGEHKDEQFGSYTVPYISPERVQDETTVRVLIAKNAISTGWDCPRAEVMVSFRSAQDQTHIAQLLGRMVRTPLARRIPGNDRLNGVTCLLPKFDKDTVDAVVAALRSGDELKPSFGRVLINPVELKPNPHVPAAVWKKFVSLPSQMRPQRGAKPAIRLTALSHELASDELLANAGKKAHSHLHAWLDVFIGERETEFKEKRLAVRTVEGRTVIAGLLTDKVRDETFTEQADAAVWNDAYRFAARILSPDIARTYTEARARRNEEADFDETLIEAREDVAALALLDNLQMLFDAQANALSGAWLAEYREMIKRLPDDRQDAYRQITALSREPQDVDLSLPVSRMEAAAAREAGGSETKFPTYKQHLLCNGKGEYPVELKDWEKTVLKAETQREGFIFWYRNPDRPTQDSLGIAYMEADETKIVRPDFLFFVELPGGSIAVDIVDPHSFHLADALPKLQGLARYAQEHPNIYRRIEAVAEVGGKMRVLDLMREDVRLAVTQASDAKSLYSGALSGDYH